MPGERQNRAIRQILLNLVGEGPVELPQNDADARVEIAREESSVQVEMIIGRERKDCDRLAHPSPLEPFTAIRASCGDKDRPDALNGARQIWISMPEDGNPMPSQRAELLGRAERYCATANDDHDRIARLRW